MPKRIHLYLVLTLFAIAVLAAFALRAHETNRLVLGPDLVTLEERLASVRVACVDGRAEGSACVEAERLTRELASRRRERI